MSDTPEPASDRLEPASDSVTSDVRSWLDWTLALALILLLPAGLVAGFYALRTDRKLQAGDIDGAIRDSQVTRRWIIGAIAGGFAVIVLLLIGLGLLGAYA